MSEKCALLKNTSGGTADSKLSVLRPGILLGAPEGGKTEQEKWMTGIGMMARVANSVVEHGTCIRESWSIERGL